MLQITMTIEEAQLRLHQAETRLLKEQSELKDGEESQSIPQLLTSICYLKGYIQGHSDATYAAELINKCG